MLGKQCIIILTSLICASGGVEITPFEVEGCETDDLLVSLLASLLWQKDTVNVWKHTTSSDGDTA